MNALDLEGVAADRRPDVAIDHITTSRQQWERANRRPRSLTARDALRALQFECLLIWTCAANVRNGVTLTDDDFDRLTLAQRRIDLLTQEAIG